SFPRALMLTGTHACPTRHVPISRKNGHVDTEFGDQDFSGPAIDPRNRIETVHDLSERGNHPFDVTTQGLDALVEVVEMREEQTEEEAMMCPKASGEGLAERWQFDPQLPAR